MVAGPDNIKIAKPKVGGGVWRAPLGTTVPTSYDEALDAAFKSLGLVGEDGVTRSEENESDDKIAWGGDAVADLPGTHSLSYGATFLESRNAETLKALYGDDNVIIDAATGAISIKSNSKRPERAIYVIDTESTREVIFNAQMTASGDITYVHNEVIQYEASWKAYPNADGNKSIRYFPGDTP